MNQEKEDHELAEHVMLKLASTIDFILANYRVTQKSSREKLLKTIYGLHHEMQVLSDAIKYGVNQAKEATMDHSNQTSGAI